MNMLDRWSIKLANIIVCSSKNRYEYKPLPDMKTELDLLKYELERARREIELSKIEWDKTFDSIADNIAIIGKDRKIIKVNKSFEEDFKKAGAPWDTFVGLDWTILRETMNFSNKCIVGLCLDTGLPQNVVMDFNGHTFHVITNPILENGNVTRVVRIARDLTSMEQQKRKLERRGRVLAAISEMSKTLTNHVDWDTAMLTVLEQLGTSLSVHRSYIYKNEVREGRICAILNNVWCNPDGKINCGSKDALVECVNYDRLGEWKYFMENGLSVQGNMTNCDICSEKHRCVCLDDIVVSAVPIFSNGEWWGFIGFDYHNGTKKWRCDDEVSLKVAADIIGGVIYHRSRYYDTLNKLENR